MILIPALDECVYAAAGQGAWYVVGDGEPRPARVSDCAAPGRRAVPDQRGGHASTRSAAATPTIGCSRPPGSARTWGDCYGYLMVATGRAELMVDPVVNVWDAGRLAADHRRGRRHVHRLAGPPHDPLRRSIATNGHVLEEVLAITKAESGKMKAESLEPLRSGSDQGKPGRDPFT